MKKILGLLMTACLFSFAACSKDNTTNPDEEKPGTEVTPEFPAKVAKTISLEEGTSFEVTPNMAWTLSIPEEQEMTRYFKIIINNEELIGYSRRGEANTKLDITVTGRSEDFDNSHTLVMTLTMGGKAQEIAEIELMKTGSVIEVYMAELNESGNSFKVEGSGENVTYIYSETAMENGAVIGLYDNFRNHLKVSANRNWQVTAPEWLNLSQKGGSGGNIVLIDMESGNDIRPFEDVKDGKLTFFVDEQTVLAEYNVVIDGCANEFEWSIINYSNVILESAGGTVTGNITAAYGSEVFFAFPDGTDEWLKFAAGQGFGDNTWSDAEKTAGLHTKDFSADYVANESFTDSRRAYLFCVPRGAADGLDKSKALNGDGTVAEGFAAYLIATYTQQHAVEERPDDVLLVQSMIGKDDNSTAGQELFALIQEYNPGNYPEGWWGSALDEMPALFKLTLREMRYCESAVMSIENADDWEIVYHPDDQAANNKWIDDFGTGEGSLYRFIFKYEEITDGSGNVIDLKWATPKYPQAYVKFTLNGHVTGALIVEIDKEALDIPLQNASARDIDIGFTILADGDYGYSSQYEDVPQYKVNGYDPSTQQPDSQGRLGLSALTLTYFTPGEKEEDPFKIDYTKFTYEFIEDGLQTARYLRSATYHWSFADGDYYIDDETGEKVASNDGYLFNDKPYVTGSQMNYTFNGSGPDQFRIVCHNTSGEVVCTVYVYYQDLSISE